MSDDNPKPLQRPIFSERAERYALSRSPMSARAPAFQKTAETAHSVGEKAHFRNLMNRARAKA